MFYRTLLVATCCSTLLMGCSSFQWPQGLRGTEVTTNVSSAEIELQTQPFNASSPFKLLSVVTGDSCQVGFDQPAASANEAKQALREDAARFGATHVFGMQCFKLPTDSSSRCYTSVSCFGQAAAPKQ